MSIEEFSIEYDGPALTGHTMDLQILGPSLMAVNDLCREANRILNDEGTMDIRVDMKAPHGGCLSVTLQIIEVTTTTAPLVSTAEILKALGFFSAGVGAGISGLLWLMKRKKKQRIIQVLFTMVDFFRPPEGYEEEMAKAQAEAEKRAKERMSLHIEEEKEFVEASFHTMSLYCDSSVRVAQRRFVAPLEVDGIEQMRIRHNSEIVGVIEKEDVQNGYYDVNAEEMGAVFSMISR